MSHRFDDAPDFVRLEAWQEVDDDHPAGRGEPAYRAVYKTLRLVVAAADFHWPNLHIRLAHGTVRRGGAEIRNAAPGRRPGHWLLLEKARLERVGEQLHFMPEPNMLYEMGGWQDEIQDAWYVEFVLINEELEPAARLAEGRSRLAPLKTMFDLHFGSRLLGVPLTEELGERHPDGHWARSLNSDLLGSESQLNAGAVDTDRLRAFAAGPLEQHLARSEEDNARLRLACDWYWSAASHSDAVTEYLHLWFVIEALCMPDTTNIAPVRRALADAVGGEPADWKQLVGRHFGRRSDLVHGHAPRHVEADNLSQLRQIVEVLLGAELGAQLHEACRALAQTVGLP